VAELVSLGQGVSAMQKVKDDFRQHWPIFILIVINVVIGLVVVRDYGQSWDEPDIQRYADQSLSAYTKFIHNENPPVYFSNLMYYGPAFSMSGMLMVRALQYLHLGWSVNDYWHLVYFLAFQIAILSLYFLSRRWMSRWAAFGAALLFSAQPLFWGHAFINPKDIPFMSFFLLSVTSGLWMVDRLFEPGQYETKITRFPTVLFENDWKLASPTRKIASLLLPLLGAALGITILVFKQALILTLAAFVTVLYRTDSQSFWGRFFTRIAPNAGNVPLESYIAKAQILFPKWGSVFFFIAGLTFAIVFLRIISRSTFSWLTRGFLTPVGKATFNYLKSPVLLLAGIALGFTTAIRLSAPFAVLLVGLYALTKKEKKPLLAFLPYGLVAVLIALLTWPYLWRDPIGRFIESMGVMSDFSKQAVDVSRFMLPKLISIQLTEPVIILFLAGIILSIINFKNEKFQKPLLLMIFWFLLPVSFIVAARSSLYDNFRQLFFLLPAVFVLVGVALEVLFTKLNRVWINLTLLFLLAVPGIYACVELHPYEYIYFNNFTGGVKGAFRHYELDYWAISYKEAAEYLNEVAPTDAKIGVVGTDLIFKPYARPDLKVYYFNGVDFTEEINYVVVTSRANNDLAVCPGSEVIKTIEREGAVLTAIKRITSPEECILSP
jgi:hypothetical protein